MPVWELWVREHPHLATAGWRMGSNNVYDPKDHLPPRRGRRHPQKSRKSRKGR